MLFLLGQFILIVIMIVNCIHGFYTIYTVSCIIEDSKKNKIFQRICLTLKWQAGVILNNIYFISFRRTRLKQNPKAIHHQMKRTRILVIRRASAPRCSLMLKIPYNTNDRRRVILCSTCSTNLDSEVMVSCLGEIVARNTKLKIAESRK